VRILVFDAEAELSFACGLVQPRPGLAASGRIRRPAPSGPSKETAACDAQAAA